MTKMLFVVSTGLICLFTACNNETKVASSMDTAMSSMAQKNLESSRTVSKAFETGDPSQIDSVVASDFVDHTEHGDMGRDSLKAMIVTMHKAFPDMKMELIKELADDDHVMSLMRFTGTSDGSMGMPKGPYDMHAIEVVKFKDGKAVEHWEYMQTVEMMKMMGHDKKMDSKMNADSAKKK